MKPLEPGCLALVTHGSDAGTVVTPEKYCPPGFKYRSASERDIRFTGEPGWITSDPDGFRSIRPSYSLLRIDGHEPETTEEEQEVTA